LQPPQIQGGLLERADLIQRLRDGRERRLTLVCAPAGYGKTTLLAQWAAADAERTPFAWVSLDERDSDPSVLWGDLITSLQAAHGRAGERSLKALAAGPKAISETALPLLVEELAKCPPLVVVLEDWHLTASRVCDETVGAFVEQSPAQVQIVISSRSDPGLPIARLRAHGDLDEIRARDLRASAAEAAVLFRDAGVRLAKADARRLTERTEGWLAGLCLALIVLREQDDPQRFVHEFSGDSRHVFDYLARDVLDKVDPEIREFMVQSSVLDRLSAPLCNAVLERSDSASCLAAIERSNLFLVSLDATRDEYRYHHLFAAVLQRELQNADPDSVAGLHARASRWYEQHGDVDRAIDHAIASRDLERVSTLVLVAAVPMLSAGRMATLNRWFQMLSWPEARADRQLAIMRALTARLSGQGRHEVERWLAVAENGPDFGPLPNGITSMRSCVAMVSSTYLSRGIGDAERSARLVLESEPAESPWRYAGLVPLGQALFLAGRREEARTPLEEARTLPGARGHVSTALGMAYLALVELAEGEVERAEHIARDALALTEELAHGASAAAANPHLALGCVLLAGTDLYGALAHLERAAELAEQDDPSHWHAHAALHLAAARHRAGDGTGARDVLTRARAELDELRDVGMLGDLYEETAAVLDERSRREGFLGEPLSEAELRILRRLAEGRSIAAVADELWLSSNTVKSHRRSIYRKLGVHSREQLLAISSELGLAVAAAREVHPGD
jgi:LuxR family maltose regulon positive regulatory protein